MGHNNDEAGYYPVGLQELFSPLGGKLNINTAPLRRDAGKFDSRDG